MKLGLITDIHEHVEHLRTALDRFHSEGVDQVVLIGDVLEMGKRMEETCRLLMHRCWRPGRWRILILE